MIFLIVSVFFFAKKVDLGIVGISKQNRRGAMNIFRLFFLPIIAQAVETPPKEIVPAEEWVIPYESESEEDTWFQEQKDLRDLRSQQSKEFEEERRQREAEEARAEAEREEREAQNEREREEREKEEKERQRWRDELRREDQLRQDQLRQHDRHF